MRRASIFMMIPLNVLLVAWVWFGRLVFGVGGWFLLILAPVALVMAIALLVTTILAFTRTPRQLSRVQVGLQVSTWVALFGCGLFMPDFGDTEDSSMSSLTQVFGYSDQLFNTSFTLAALCGAASVVLWLALLVALIADRRDPVPDPVPGPVPDAVT